MTLPTQRFRSRNVIVTGATRGIGRAILDGFYAEGARVLAVANDEAGVEAVGAEFGDEDRIVTHVADMGIPAEAKGIVDVAVERFGHLDVLVNNAGVMPGAPVLEITEEDWTRTFAVNVTGPFLATQEAARHMTARRQGSVVNIASTNAFRGEAPETHYNSSKAALVMMTKCFALELGRFGVRFNCVAPGETLTYETAAEMDEGDVESESCYVQRIPLGRPGFPSEPARAVLFLASDEASFISGQTLIVDGGELSGDFYDVDERPPVSTGWFEAWREDLARRSRG